MEMILGVEPPKTATAKWIWFSLALVCVVTALVRIPLLPIPFERDEGEYAYIGWRLDYGELPYRDWFDQKPPGVFWVYRLALMLPGNPIVAVHFMGLLFSAASGCALFFLARRFMDHFMATMSAILFVILSADPLLEGTAANTELFMLLPLILSQVVFFSTVPGGTPKKSLMFLCGALTGLAVAFKQVAGVNWVFLLAVYPLFCAAGPKWRSTAIFGACSAVGAAAVWALIILYFFLRHGLPDFMENVFFHNLQYVHSLPWSVRAKFCLQTFETIARSQALVWLLSAAGLWALFRARSSRLLIFLAGGLVASALGVSASGYFFPHYFQQLLPGLAIASVLGAHALYRAGFWQTLPGRARGVASAGALLALPLTVLYPFWFSYSPETAVGKIYPGNTFGLMPQFGERIAQMTRPDDRVYIFGAEPELFFYAHRTSATRYIFLFPLYGQYPGVLEKQKATADEVIRNQPAAAVWFPNGLFFAPGTEQMFTRWSYDYLKSHFREDTYLMMDQAGRMQLTPTNPPDQTLAAVLMAHAPVDNSGH
jgi:4-amino-4-deoxy-L-arabinose transferase-like glycosyltransferase